MSIHSVETVEEKLFLSCSVHHLEETENFSLPRAAQIEGARGLGVRREMTENFEYNLD